MFKHRSYKKELLDEAVIDKADLYQNLKELEIINSKLGGHKISIDGVAAVVTDKSKQYNLIDIGCGGGDSLKALDIWANSNDYQLGLNGIDLLPDCIAYAQKNCAPYPEITFTCADFRTVFSMSKKVDIVHASLFCHHFTEKEIIEFILLCNNNGAIFVINDLERNPIAYYSIKILTGLFSKSVMVKNDAPLSVLRGFKKTEWRSILQQAGIKKYTIQNKWAFRHLITIYPNEQ